MEHVTLNGGAGTREVYVCMSHADAGHLLAAMVTALNVGAWDRDAREILTSLALFLRDYLGAVADVPSMAEAELLETRNVA
jgi:hypothetical protein